MKELLYFLILISVPIAGILFAKMPASDSLVQAGGDIVVIFFFLPFLFTLLFWGVFLLAVYGGKKISLLCLLRPLFPLFNRHPGKISYLWNLTLSTARKTLSLLTFQIALFLLLVTAVVLFIWGNIFLGLQDIRFLFFIPVELVGLVVIYLYLNFLSAMAGTKQSFWSWRQHMVLVALLLVVPLFVLPPFVVLVNMLLFMG